MAGSMHASSLLATPPPPPPSRPAVFTPPPPPLPPLPPPPPSQRAASEPPKIVDVSTTGNEISESGSGNSNKCSSSENQNSSEISTPNSLTCSAPSSSSASPPPPPPSAFSSLSSAFSSIFSPSSASLPPPPPPLVSSVSSSTSSSESDSDPSPSPCSSSASPFRWQTTFSLPSWAGARTPKSVGTPDSSLSNRDKSNGNNNNSSNINDKECKVNGSFEEDPALRGYARRAPNAVSFRADEVLFIRSSTTKPKLRGADIHEFFHYADKYFVQSESIVNRLKALTWKSSLSENVPLTEAMQATVTSVRQAQELAVWISTYMGEYGPSIGGYPSTHKAVRAVCVQITCALLAGDDSLRDEFYCQLITQLTNTPAPTHKLRGWRLMAICTGLVTPSSTLFPYLNSFLLQSYSQCQHQVVQDRRYVSYSHRTLERTRQNGPRKFPPTDEEITSTELQTNVCMRVQLLGRAPVHVVVSAQTTAIEISDTIHAQMELKLPIFEGTPCFGLVQAQREGKIVKHTPLDDNARVFDVVSAWMTAISEAEEADNEEPLFELKLAPKYYLYCMQKPEVLSESALNMYYLQGVDDVTQGRLPISQTEALQLTAIALSASYNGDFTEEAARDWAANAAIDSMDELASAVVKFLPVCYPGMDWSEQEQKLQASLALLLLVRNLRLDLGLTELSPLQLQHRFVETLQRLPHYGALCADVVLVADAKIVDWDFEEHCLQNSRKPERNRVTEPRAPETMGVSERGIIFMNPQTRKIRRVQLLNDVVDCGYTKKLFWYVFGEAIQVQRVEVYETNQGRELHAALRVYQGLPANQPLPGSTELLRSLTQPSEDVPKTQLAMSRAHSSAT